MKYWNASTHTFGQACTHTAEFWHDRPVSTFSAGDADVAYCLKEIVTMKLTDSSIYNGLAWQAGTRHCGNVEVEHLIAASHVLKAGADG